MIIRHHYQSALAASPSTVWALLRNFGATTWHPFVVDSHLVDTDLRRLSLADGTEAYERLLALDDQKRRLVYTFCDPAPIPVAGARISVAVTPTSDGGADVRWSGEFEVLDTETGRQVKRMNTEVVWPAAADGLRQATADLTSH